MVAKEERDSNHVREGDDTVDDASSGLSNHYKLYSKIKEELFQCGLAPNEAEIYIALIKNGPKQLSEIAGLMNLDRTETYHLLSGLQNKGVVTATFKHPIQFVAVPFEKVLKIMSKGKKEKHFAAKVQRLASLLATIPDSTNVTSNQPWEKFVTVDSSRVYTKAKEITLKAKHEILILGHKEDFDNLSSAGILHLIKELAIDGVSVRLLTTCDSDSIASFQEFNGRIIRYVATNTLEKFSFIIGDNNQLLVFVRDQSGKEQQMVIWTSFEPFINVLRSLFSEIWNSAMSSPELVKKLEGSTQ